MATNPSASPMMIGPSVSPAKSGHNRRSRLLKRLQPNRPLNRQPQSTGTTHPRPARASRNRRIASRRANLTESLMARRASVSPIKANLTVRPASVSRTATSRAGTVRRVVRKANFRRSPTREKANPKVRPHPKAAPTAKRTSPVPPLAQMQVIRHKACANRVREVRNRVGNLRVNSVGSLLASSVVNRAENRAEKNKRCV